MSNNKKKKLSNSNYIIKDNEKDILKKIKKNGLELKSVSDKFKNNETIVLIAVKQNGLALEFASDNLKNNKKIIITAINQNIHVLDFLHIWIKDYKSILNSFNYIDDKKIIFKIIKYKENFYKYLNNNIKEDINITKKLLKVNNNIFYFLLPIMFENIDILLLGLNSNNTISLIYQSKDDFLKIIIAAINRNIHILDFFHIWIKNYKNIFDDLNYVHDKKIIFKILEYDPSMYNYLNNNIKENINITKELIKINDQIIYYLSYKMLMNVDIVLLCLDSTVNFIDELPLELHQTKEVVLKIIEIYNLKNQYEKSKLQILHIGFIKLDNKYTEDYIKYRFIDFNLYNIDEIIKIFKYYLNITNRDVVIFIELDSTPYSRYVILELVEIKKHDTDKKINNLYKELNKVIYNSTESHKNIKIINIMTDNSLNISYNFYKIVNIIINNSSSIGENLHYNNNYEIDNCIYKKIYLYYNIIINDMLATHWLNKLINTPKFLKNRQKQISRASWLYTIFNSLYLVKSIRKDMFSKYEEYKKIKLTNFPIEYKNLRDSNYVHNVKDVLYSLIGNLKNNITPVNNIDYIIVIAAYIKEYINKTLKEDQIFNKFKNYKLIHEPFYTICQATNSNKLRTILCSDKIKNKEDLDDLNNICDYTIYDKSSICDSFPENDNRTNGYIYGCTGYSDGIYAIIRVIFNIILLSNLPKTLVDTSIILIDIDNNPNYNLSNDNINKYGNVYKLKSSYLSNNSKIMPCGICGLKNNNIYYIYDAFFNIWVKEDWGKLLNNDKNNYLELLEYKKKFLQIYDLIIDPEFFNFTISYLIYVC